MGNNNCLRDSVMMSEVVALQKYGEPSSRFTRYVLVAMSLAEFSH